MLSSVTDLLHYIDENQLTSEFGGTLDYCHSDWIVLRTVSFQRTAVALPQLMLHWFFRKYTLRCFFFPSAGHRKFCRDGQRHRTDAAELRH